MRMQGVVVVVVGGDTVTKGPLALWGPLIRSATERPPEPQQYKPSSFREHTFLSVLECVCTKPSAPPSSWLLPARWAVWIQSVYKCKQPDRFWMCEWEMCAFIRHIPPAIHTQLVSINTVTSVYVTTVKVKDSVAERLVCRILSCVKMYICRVNRAGAVYKKHILMLKMLCSYSDVLQRTVCYYKTNLTLSITREWSMSHTRTKSCISKMCPNILLNAYRSF